MTNMMRLSRTLRKSTLINVRCTTSRAASSSASDAPPSSSGRGLGYGNVMDQMLSSTDGRDLFQFTKSPHTCSIIGAPMTYGQPFAGTDSGPSMLRDAGLREMLCQLGWRVEDLPDLNFDPDALRSSSPPTPTPNLFNKLETTLKAKNAELVGRGSEQVYQVVNEKLKEGNFPLILGGDHSIAIGSLAGVLSCHPDIGVVWVDAHTDINTPFISGSGNMHGMPIGLHIEGMSPVVDASSGIPGLDWMFTESGERKIPQLPADSIVYVGLRDVDPPERHLIQSLGIKAFTMHEIDRYGIGKVMEMALDHLMKDNPQRRLHLSYDIDAVDPMLAPATGTTVRGGLTYREAHYVAESVAYSGNLVSAEIVELNPTLSCDDGARETVELGLQLITSFMGKSII